MQPKPNMKIEISRRQEHDPLTIAEKERTAAMLGGMMLMETGGRTLRYDRDRALGAKDSAHDVFFVKTDKGPANSKASTYAVKRFRNEESARGELEAIGEARSRGMKTLRPIGDDIYAANGVGYLLVTEHVPRFTTMNYLGWRDAYAGQPNYDRRYARPLSRIGEFVAQMHSAGITHGDLQLKNIAQNQFGQFVLFDLENVTFADPSNIDDHDHVGKAGADLQDLVGSLAMKGYLWNSTDVVFEQEVLSRLIDPYLDNISISNTELISHAHHAVLEAEIQRPQLHNDFSSRIGLPS